MEDFGKEIRGFLHTVLFLHKGMERQTKLVTSSGTNVVMVALQYPFRGLASTNLSGI